MDCPTGQTGYLVLNADGAILNSGGDLDNDEKSAGIFQKLISLSNDRLGENVFNQGFKRLTITYDDHAYVICLSNRKIYIVKRQTDIGD
ncbi:late endosomal/lysosomal adaptor, MAPK and MTOR activator 4 [Rhynchophorus ferrugineus]